MAIKRADVKETKEVKKLVPKVEVDLETVEEEVTEEVIEDLEVSTIEEETEKVEEPELEIEVEVEESELKIEVDTESALVNTANKPDGNVRIRMREDHKCSIGGEFYDLKKGKNYTVPMSVKRILNKAGLLLPL